LRDYVKSMTSLLSTHAHTHTHTQSTGRTSRGGKVAPRKPFFLLLTSAHSASFGEKLLPRYFLCLTRACVKRHGEGVEGGVRRGDRKGFLISLENRKNNKTNENFGKNIFRLKLALPASSLSPRNLDLFLSSTRVFQPFATDRRRRTLSGLINKLSCM
jgi:hypothetical protein